MGKQSVMAAVLETQTRFQVSSCEVKNLLISFTTGGFFSVWMNLDFVALMHFSSATYKYRNGALDTAIQLWVSHYNNRFFIVFFGINEQFHVG